MEGVKIIRENVLDEKILAKIRRDRYVNGRKYILDIEYIYSELTMEKRQGYTNYEGEPSIVYRGRSYTDGTYINLMGVAFGMYQYKIGVLQKNIIIVYIHIWALG